MSRGTDSQARGSDLGSESIRGVGSSGPGDPWPGTAGPAADGLRRSRRLAFNVPVSKTIQISRRTFVRDCAALAAATGLPLWFVERELAAARRRHPPSLRQTIGPGIALIGCGGMGMGDAKSATRFGDIVAVCDVDESHTAAAAKQFTVGGKAPAQFTDFRKVLERKDVNIIVQATPDHWHTLINLAAAQRQEGHLRREAADAHDRRGQAAGQSGPQAGRRPADRHAAAQPQAFPPRVRAGAQRPHRHADARSTCSVPAGLREGPFTPVPVPPEFHWDMWLGQAPQVEYLKERCHQTFRWWWDYSGGPVTDWGAHHNDIARWAIGLDGPIAIEAKAPIEPIPGGYTTPPEFEATLTWANGVTQIVKTTLDDTPFGAIINPDGQRNGVGSKERTAGSGSTAARSTRAIRRCSTRRWRIRRSSSRSATITWAISSTR